MRLKGRFRDPVAFLRIMQTMAKLSSRCILRFSPNKIIIVVQRGADAVEAWAELEDVTSFFEEYIVESNNQNEVNLEVVSDTLCQAMKFTTSASRVTVKLAKRGKQAMLSMDITAKSLSGQDVVVTHHVMISVKRSREMETVRSSDAAMEAQNYLLQSSFPDLAEVRTVVERMRALDIASNHPKIAISANMQGQLRIALRGDDVSVESRWEKLQTDMEYGAVLNRSGMSVDARQRFYHVRVDARAFGRLLACQVTDFSAEMWMAHKTCCTFLIHVRKSGATNRDHFVAHIMVNLSGYGSGDD